MWSGTNDPNARKNLDRGGFQNRDVGRTQFDDNYGPDYGIDYARFADTPDDKKDHALCEKILLSISENFLHLGFKVRNGFVIVKGDLPDQAAKDELRRSLKEIKEVVEVIWDVKLAFTTRN